MPDPTPKHSPESLHRLLGDLRADFDGLRQRERPIKIGLIHRASNSEAEGVKGYPSWTWGAMVTHLGAGSRMFRQNFEPDGTLRYVDPPAVDIHGQPIIHPVSGKGIDVTMAASRSVQLAGDPDAVARLRSLAERGGRLALARRDKTLRLLADWRFSGPEQLWWALVFELAWSGLHPLLSTTRMLWQTLENGRLVKLPYDRAQVRQLAAPAGWAMGMAVPERWLERLPEAYMSEIGDAASACSDLTAVIADELEAALSADNVESLQGEDVHEPTEWSEAPETTGYVATPPDPSAYVPASDIVGKHAPVDMRLTAKQLRRILEDYTSNHIRWTRPTGKRGKPRPNRRGVHLSDWLAYVERQRAVGPAADDHPWPTVSADEITARAEALRGRRLSGK